MKVKIYAPEFCDRSLVDERNFMELSEGATLKDVYRILRIPFLMRPIVVCTVNHRKEKLSKKLKDGDIIGFMVPVPGG